jgi:hypothetical protein
MAYTAGFSVNVGDPTKASDVSTLAANDDFLKNAIDTFIANDANNRVLTGTGSGTANGEANLTFDGSTLALTGAQTISSTLSVTDDLAVATDGLFVDVSASRVGVNNTCSTVANFTVKASQNGIHVQKIENAAGQSIQETYSNGSGDGSLSLRNSSGFQRVQLSTHENSYITAGYNFGLSTSSPAARLHIIGGDGDPSAAHSGDAQLILENNGTTFLEVATGASHFAGLTFSDGTATRGAVLYDHGTGLGGGADSLHFQVGGSLRAVINSSGDVGIGSLSPTYKLVVSNGGAAGYEFNVSGLNGGVNTVVYNRTTSAYVDSAHFALNYYIFTGSTPAEVLRATSAGEVWIKNTSDQGSYNLQVGGTGVWGAGAYVNGSDERLKKSIATYTDNALDLVNQMRPVTFEYVEDYSDDRATQIGFVAQDLQEVLQGKEYLDGIVKDDAEHLNVAYQSLIPVLTKAIQELTARIEALEAA